MKDKITFPIAIVLVVLSTIGYFAYHLIVHCYLRPHNNGNCIENHCLGDEVTIKQLGIDGYISDYFRWKPSQPVEYTITYKNDIGEANTIVVKAYELKFKKDTE